MHRLRPLLLTFLPLALACSDSQGPTDPNGPAGTYTATEFLITFNDTTTIDELHEGVTLSLTLTPDSMTTGFLSVPAAGGAPLSLAGTWSRSGDTVSFHGPVDTFLQRLPFRLAPGKLDGDGTVGPEKIRITLTRQSPPPAPGYGRTE